MLRNLLNTDLTGGISPEIDLGAAGSASNQVTEINARGGKLGNGD